MENQEIRKEVQTIIERWSYFQNRNRLEVNFSEGAVLFIFQLIVNIKEDPSDFWRNKEIDYDAAQQLAISLLPNALNDIIRRNNQLTVVKSREVRITSWEIWHSLSRVLDNWCFMPKDI